MLTGVAQETCDILDSVRLREIFVDAAPEVVLHLAARTDLDESAQLADYSANVEGVTNIVAAIRAAPSVKRAICTSTQLVYRLGSLPGSDTEYDASTVYGSSKIETERIWREADGGSVTWSIVRPTTIWGPRMNPHYLRYFRMIRNGRYFHVGREPSLKSYGYVGNTVYQYEQLMLAPPEQIHRRTFYIADYEPLSLQGWSNAFQVALAGPPIRTVPRFIAVGLARVGDAVNALGIKRFPFNSFRLNNVLTPYDLDMTPTRDVVGELPFTMHEGVDITAEWVHQVLDE